MRLIVLNCFSRNALAAVNSLPDSWEIFAGATKKARGFINPDGYLKSPRIREIFRHADPRIDKEGFVRDIVAACAKYGVEGILPTGTDMTNYLSLLRGEIACKTPAKVMVEDYAKMSRMSDKWNIFEIAKEVGVPVPHTIELARREKGALDVVSQFRFPAVFKPRLSYGSIGVRFFDDPETCRGFIDSVVSSGRPQGPGVILQERIDGQLMDVNSCAQAGRPLTLLSQRRVKTLYDFGGGGIVNVTTDEERPKRYAQAILQKMEWNGPCQFEFIAGKDGEYYLIEANPKLWGTTHLSVLAGCNVVRQTVDVFSSDVPLPVTEAYEVGLLYRWLFPENFYNWIQPPRTFANIKRRIAETFSSYDAPRSVHNLQLHDIPHLMGMVVNGTSLQ